MPADDLTINTFVDEIPQPFSTNREEVSQDTILPNQYKALPTTPYSGTRVFYTLSATDGAPDSETFTQDFVLTHIIIQTNGVPNASACDRTAYVYLNGVVLKQTAIFTENTTEFATLAEVMPIPNWKMYAGEVVSAEIAADADASYRIYVTFVGYQE